jgi:hypothetical protein
MPRRARSPLALAKVVSILAEHTASRIPRGGRNAYNRLDLRRLGRPRAVSVQAAPLPPVKANPAELSAAPPMELVAQGCGPGWHRTPLARLLGSLALGQMRPELVIR